MAETMGPDDGSGGEWQRLVDRDSAKPLFRGSVIRCPADWPYESIIDFLVVRNFETNRGMTLVVASGYKAGHILVVLPEESEVGHHGMAEYVSVDWLKANWSKWGYAEAKLEHVYVRDHYPAPKKLPPDGPDQSHRGNTRQLKIPSSE